MRCGLLALCAGTVVLLGGLDADAGAEIVFVPLLLIGLGIGALASQLGSVTVSAVPDDESAEVGGVQNTMTNLGASLGTALAGSLMIAAVSAAFLTNIQQNPDIPDRVKSEAHGQARRAGSRSSPTPTSTTALDEAGVRTKHDRGGARPTTRSARIDGLKAALGILAVLALVGLLYSGRIPRKQPQGGGQTADEEDDP